MSHIIKAALLSVGGVVAVMLLTYGLLLWGGVLGGAKEQIRHNIIKESQAWRDGKARDLSRLCLAHSKADAAGKIGIANAIRDQFAAEDMSNVPAHLQSCLFETGAR